MTRTAFAFAGVLVIATAWPGPAQDVAPSAPAPDAMSPQPQQAPPEPPRFAMADRNRLTLSFGYWDAPSTQPPEGIVSGAHTQGLSGGFEYSRFLSDALAVSIGTHALPIESGSVVGRHGVHAGSRAVISTLLGVRWNPSRGDIGSRSVKPYVLAGVGPVVGSTSGTAVGHPAGKHGFYAGTSTEVTLGGRVGGGIDFHLGRSWAIGAEASYHFMGDFDQPIGDHDNYSGFEMRIGVSWLFGKGRAVVP